MSAQPTFREESLEQAISEKLYNIRQKINGKNQNVHKPQVYYRPPQKANNVNDKRQSVFMNNSDKYQRRVTRKYQNISNPNLARSQVKGIGFVPKNTRPWPTYEKEKRLETLSVNEINSAVKMLLP